MCEPLLPLAFQKMAISLSQSMPTWAYGVVVSLQFYLFKLLEANGTKEFKNGENEFLCLCGSGRFHTLAARRSLLLAVLVCTAVGVLTSSLLLSFEFYSESLRSLIDIFTTSCLML